MTTNKFRLDGGTRQKTVRNDDGTAVLKSLPVFKVGKFTSNAGKQVEYTIEDLHTIAENFETLREGPLPNIPVRADHGQSIDAVVGYVDELYVQGKTLKADLTFTEPEAAEKWDRSTYRNRSSEIGGYRTNDGQLYEKAYVGLAFVDLPAVEGLDQDDHFSLSPNPTSGDSTHVFTQEDLDAARAEGHQAGVAEGHKDGLAEGSANAFAAAQGTVTVAKFSIAGAEVEDAEVVQAHIADLESKVEKFDTAERVNFVEGLVADKKILASKRDDVLEMVSKFDASGFENFKQIQGFSSALPQFDGDNVNDSKQEKLGTKETDPKALHESIIENYRLGGLSEEQIEQTPAFKALQKADA